MPDILSAALRALSFVLLLQAAGVAFFLALFGRFLSSSSRLIRHLGQGSAALGLVAVAGHFALEAPRMGGEMSGLWRLPLQEVALHSSVGVASGLKVIGLAIMACGLGREGELANTASMAGAMIAVLAFLFTGHTSINPDRWMLAPLLGTHLLIVAFWFGALPPLYAASKRESPILAAKLLERFSTAAGALVPLIFLAGVAMAVILVPGMNTLRQPYGELLLAKVAGFAVLMGLASLNKWRLAPAIASGGKPALVALRRSLAAEYVLITGVLTVTAIMTAFFSPQ